MIKITQKSLTMKEAVETAKHLLNFTYEEIVQDLSKSRKSLITNVILYLERHRYNPLGVNTIDSKAVLEFAGINMNIIHTDDGMKQCNELIDENDLRRYLQIQVDSYDGAL